MKGFVANVKQRWWIAIVLIVLVGGGWMYIRQKAAAKAKESAIGRTTKVGRGDVTIKVTETGTLEPVSQVDVKSRVAGRLQRIFVKEGQPIRAGDPIAIVDPTEVTRQVEGVKAQLAASQASLAQAEQNYHLSVQQTRLAISRATVALRQAESGYKDAEIGLAQARSQYKQTAAPNRSQDISSAQFAVARSEAQLADTKRTLTRQQSLVDKGFVAQSAADSAGVQVTFAEKDLQTQRERLALLKEGPRREDIATSKIGIEAARSRLVGQQAAVDAARVALETERANAALAGLRLRDVDRSRADVRQIENQLAQQSVQLSETRIVAPISGEITGKYQEEGELIASATAGFAQGAAVVSIADLSKMQVRVNINEVDVARVKVGQPVEISVDSVPGKRYVGRVSAIAAAAIGKSLKRDAASAGQTSGTGGVVRFEVKVTVDNVDRRLRPGMTAVVDIILERHKNVLTLPAEAIKPNDSVSLVAGVGKDRKTGDRKITTGLKNDAEVEITTGVSEGDTVEIPKISAKDRRKIKFNGPD